MRPQDGLLPLGTDPRSHLQEFAHLSSGAPARRDPRSGLLGMDAETGLVFVLIPGGRAILGAQSHDPAGLNYDPAAGDSEAPPFAVDLEPFFLSKFEMTRAQWRRLSCTSPDADGPSVNDVQDNHDPEVVAVDNVSWLECHELLALYGLELPTESEWEYACRAGTSTRWWTGNDPGRYRLTHSPGTRAVAVNEGRANSFGLFQMHDGVREWCSDLYRDHLGSGARSRPNHATTMRSVRHAQWNYEPMMVNGLELSPRERGSRSSARDKQPETAHQFDLGLRPLRRIR
jgi:formylglycine-generating enzyme required for sulfatase activity